MPESYYLRYRSGRNSLHAKFGNTENQRCFVQTRFHYVDAHVLFPVMPVGLLPNESGTRKHRENIRFEKTARARIGGSSSRVESRVTPLIS